VTRVLLVHQPTEGGVGRHVADLARELSARGHEPITCGPAAPAGVTGHWPHIPLELHRSPVPADLDAVRRLAGIVRRTRPDVVHAHSSKAGAVARLARPLHPGIPVLYTPHGYSFAGYFESELERRTYRLVEQALSPLGSRIVCVCDAEARLARQVAPAARIRVVHNGVPPAPPGLVTRRDVTAGAAHTPTLCALTQLRPGKGIETLLEAFTRLRQRTGEVQLMIWGDGPDSGRLRQLAAHLGLSDSVRFPGPTSDPLLVMAAADIFVLPSLAEAFPYVVLEAMSVEVPTVASDVGGIREALDDGRAGRLVAPADAAALACALSGLLEDPTAARQLARAARRRVQSLFTLPEMVRGIERVYAEVTGSTPP
jgi:glycosyltransferase involved in cell wall biosynthesis